MNFKGKVYEKIAQNYLVEKGYKIVEKNFNVKNIGEVDIIATKDGWLVFVEVKARKKTYYCPHETVNKYKKNKIIKTSLVYLKKNSKILYEGIRYDVISIEDNGLKGLEITHIENVISDFNRKYYF
ncbi:MAG: YraN family protein [Elusimicrobiales bacterium]|nr:YraN family protein [Elusimicrobiales bacterium]